jgi:hypothetical protein
MQIFKTLLFSSLISILVISCNSQEKEKADLLVINATIYTVDSTFSKAKAMAVKDGKILELGSSKNLKSKYDPKKSLDAEGQTIVPGLFDAHAHFLGYGLGTQKVDLRGAKDFDEVLERVKKFQKREKSDFITGRGWDQNSWPNKKFPKKDKLDSIFPETPVALTRIDGHAMLVNQKALDLAKIDASASVEGGSFKKENGKLTGVLIDNAQNKLKNIIPAPSEKDLAKALLRTQKKCLSFGLTTVSDAGVSHNVIQMMDSLTLKNELKIGLYPMLIYNSPHLDDYLQNGMGKNKGVSCQAVKLYGDGALGSRGAALKKPYADDPGNLGKMIVSPERIESLAAKVANSNFQLNTHAIGDSTNSVVLKAYESVLDGKPDRRWRVEHAQIVDSVDLRHYSKNIIPSVQPTHAISDMDWAGARLGEERLKNAYAYKRLLKQAGLLVLGTDFPVEEMNPFRTFYAAVARKDKLGKPKNGFMSSQSITRKQALKGMTIWAAYSQFSDDKKGSLESGKQADFVILDRDLMTVSMDSTLNTQAKATYIKGEKVF